MQIIAGDGALTDRSGLKEQLRWFQFPAPTRFLSDPTEIPPPSYHETSVAIPLSHCVSCGIADYRCYTPTFFHTMAYCSPKTDLTRGVSQTKLASEAYRALGGRRTK